MFFFKSALIFVSIISATLAQESLGNRPDECQRDRNFCMNFCLTTNKETVWAQCGRDGTSCICTDQYHRSVKVRFIEERMPVPPTTTTTTTPAPVVRPVQYVNSEPVNQYASPPVPELLVCDASEGATMLCNQFCITDIGAYKGLCNITDYTCLCQGVSPAVVQNVPIPAIFNGPLPPPTTPRPPPPQQHFWTPITPSHPNYNPNSISNGFYPSYPQPPQQVFQHVPYQQPEPHYIPEDHLPSSQLLNNHPIQFQVPTEQIVGQGITMSQPQIISATTVNEEIKTHPEDPVVHAQQESLPVEGSENHRQRRSAGTSYSSVLSFGLDQTQRNTRSCSIYSCEKACSNSEFGMPRCVPKCIDNTCYCMCQPPNYDAMIQEAIEDSIGMGSRPMASGGGYSQGQGFNRPSVLPQGSNFDFYGPPPPLY